MKLHFSTVKRDKSVKIALDVKALNQKLQKMNNQKPALLNFISLVTERFEKQKSGRIRFYL